MADEHDDPYREVGVAIDEGRKFLAKMPPELRSAPFAEASALAIGMLRAIMECPDCGPGHYRVPIEREGQEYAVCPDCRGVWIRRPPEQKKARRRQAQAAVAKARGE